MKHALAAALRRIGLYEPARRAYRRARYFGTRYACPICGARLRSFLPGGERHAVLTEKAVVGGGYRPNAVCPVCGALDRERLVFLYLKHRTDLLSPGMKLLHVAPERGLAAWLQNGLGLGYVSADLYRFGLMAKIDLMDIQFPDGSFDAIICNHVLEHVFDDAKAMAEIYRVLSPSGWAILQVPISRALAATYEDCSITEPADRERAFGQSDHIRIYAADYVDRLRQAGFEVAPFQWRASPEPFGGRRNPFALIEEESIFHVRRPAASVARGQSPLDQGFDGVPSEVVPPSTQKVS